MLLWSDRVASFEETVYQSRMVILTCIQFAVVVVVGVCTLFTILLPTASYCMCRLNDCVVDCCRLQYDHHPCWHVCFALLCMQVFNIWYVCVRNREVICMHRLTPGDYMIVAAIVSAHHHFIVHDYRPLFLHLCVCVIVVCIVIGTAAACMKWVAGRQTRTWCLHTSSYCRLEVMR